MQKPVIPFEPSKWVQFTNPFEGIQDTNEVLAILANIRSYLTTNSVSAMKNTLQALKRNVQDLVHQEDNLDIIQAANVTLTIFAEKGL